MKVCHTRWQQRWRCKDGCKRCSEDRTYWMWVGPECVFAATWVHGHAQRGVDKVSRSVWNTLGLKGLWLISLETSSQEPVGQESMTNKNMFWPG